MALSAHFHSEGHHAFGPKSATRNESRASALARMATSAPKLTYGKHKNNILPLTGIQFFHSNAIDAVNDRKRLAASNAIISATNQHSSDAEDSPLSDAEPIARTHNSTSSSTRTRRVSLPTVDKSMSRLHRLKNGDVSDGCSRAGENGASSDSPKAAGIRSGRAALPTHKKSKRKPLGIMRSRLPLNELVLIPDLSPQERRLPKRGRKKPPKDPISSSAQYMLDLVCSDGSDSTPAKRKANVPLSTIRKRLRTPSSKYKSLKTLRRKYHASQITPTGSQLRRIVGDGFDHSELTAIPRSRYATEYKRNVHGPLLPDLQALSLVSGPLPNVVFTSSSQLDLEDNPNRHHGYFSQDLASATTSSRSLDRLSSRRVEFKSDVDRDISAQLASVSAPRRERSVSLECGSDDGDEGDDEGDDDDEEADENVDENEPAPDEDCPELGRHGMMYPSLNFSPELKVFSRNGSHLFRAPSTSDRSIPASHLPGSHRRSTPTGVMRLNEVNEIIDNDYRFDDMLLDNQHEIDETMSGTHAGSVMMVEASNSDNRIHPYVERASSRPSIVQNPRVESLRTRSILRNSTPYVPSKSNRPESTASNTRRNSTIEVEQSHYFSAAKDQLDLSFQGPIVLRKKSGSRFHASIEVPYSDDMVPETSPRKVNYTDTRQLHTLKCTREAV